ncbi:MAG: FapA family protein [Helicobacteraceae bacterium]|nr:FapA family protein [Helicobacteraceae bacterium]
MPDSEEGLEKKSTESGGVAARFLNANTIETDNIPAALKESANRYGLKTSQIDFQIQSATTFVKFPESAVPCELTPAMIGRLSDAELLIDGDFAIKQIYTASFTPAPMERDRQIIAEVAANGARTKATATIMPASKIRAFSSVREYLIDELNKLKLRYGMIIGLREGSMKDDIAVLVNKIRIHDCVPEPFKVTLCDWVAPSPTINANLLLHFKDKDRQAPKESDRIDYADRGFIKTVETGELLIEYIKPKNGTAGRDFRGGYIPVLKARKEFFPIREVDSEAIDTRESDRAIGYYAKRSGYVAYKSARGGSLSIGDTIEVESVDFKTTGNIQAGLDREIKIRIEGEDASEDHIGPNTKIEASEIALAGSVANGAQVKAVKVSVAGQTHSTSSIVAESALIGVHKGMLEAKTVKIDRLEHGRVSADDVEIELAIGGMIWARRIVIGVLRSHATLIASERIEIKRLAGGENHIYIEAAANAADRKRLETLMTESKACNREANAAFRKYDKKRAILLRNKAQFDQLRERVESDRLAGKNSPLAFVERYNRYIEEMKNARALKEEWESAQSKQEELQDELSLIQNRVLNAVVINKDIWRNYNEIRFRLLSPPKELLFVPKENSRAGEIRLEISGVEDYAIKAIE